MVVYKTLHTTPYSVREDTMQNNVYELYLKLASFYKLSDSDTQKLWDIIKPICEHEEFIKRCNPPFFHHDIKLLGEHILSDTIKTYKIINKFNEKKKKDIININLAIYISMFHDLYECPWQNQKIKNKFCNMHGFRHPLEAVINAISWYPEYFENKKEAVIIIDGILHHMFPLAVRAIDKKPLELNNQEKYDALPQIYKDYLKSLTASGKMGHFSLRSSFFLEGRFVSRADKLVTINRDLKSVNGYLTLIGKSNKNLPKDTKK